MLGHQDIESYIKINYFIFQANEGDTCATKGNVMKSELRSLRKMARRMILCQEEKVRPHCWLRKTTHG